MIRVIRKDGTQTEFPGCNGAMPFMGDASKTAIVIVSKTNPAQGPHEVVAVLDTGEIEKLEEVFDEGQS